MMDEALKKDVRRCKVAGNSRALRTHIAKEAAESREMGSGGKKGGQGSNAMDVSAVAGSENIVPPSAGSAAAAAPAVAQTQQTGDIDNLGKGKLGLDQCKI